MPVAAVAPCARVRYRRGDPPEHPRRFRQPPSPRPSRGSGTRNVRRSQAFVEKTQARAVMKDDLDRLTPLSEKYEHRPPTGVPPDPLRHDAGESIKAPAQVNGLQPDEHLHPMRDHRRPRPPLPRASSTARTSPRVVRSNRDGMITRAPATSTTRAASTAGFPSIAGAKAGLATRTTRASRTLRPAGPTVPSRRRVLPSRYAPVPQPSPRERLPLAEL